MGKRRDGVLRIEIEDSLGIEKALSTGIEEGLAQLDPDSGLGWKIQSLVDEIVREAIYGNPPKMASQWMRDTVKLGFWSLIGEVKSDMMAEIELLRNRLAALEGVNGVD